jgi:NAD(P) transhydrogenase
MAMAEKTGAPAHFDLVVIGSGPAGEKGAAQAAYFGKSVAVVERMPEPGGASVHTGTLPSKTLRESALYLTGFRRRELYGMTLTLDRRKSLRTLTGRLRTVTDGQVRQIRRNLDRHAIALYEGKARFLSAREVGVFDSSGAERHRLGFDVCLVATGSSPLPPRGITFEDPDVNDSDRILSFDRLPDSLAVVGGGVIGCEYASIFAALGTKVTLVEGRDRLLPFLDGEISSALEIALRRMGAEVLMGDAVEEIRRIPGRRRNGLRLSLGSGRTLSADKVLFSAGRRGNTQGLGLEAAGVRFDERGRIPVDEAFRTNVSSIYAAGDVIGFPALAATSMEQGRVAICRAFGFPYKTEVSHLIPYGVYTVPEISMVGATEESLREKEIPYEVGRARYENNARGQITGDPDGFVKILFDPESQRLLGAHVIGGSATELVHIPGMLMMKGGGLDDLIAVVFNFPTYSECFKYAAYDGLQRLQARGRAFEPAPKTRSRPPASRPWFIGVDLTDPHAKTVRPATVALMDRWRRVRLSTWRPEPEGRGLVPEEVAADGFLLALDGPQGLSRPGRRLRAAERALRTAGRTGPHPPRTGPYAGFLRGSVELFAALRRSGLGLVGEAPEDDVVLMEVYPADVWIRLAKGRRLPPKKTQAGLRLRWELLRSEGVELESRHPLDPKDVTHDQLDAAACAFAAYLWATGKGRLVGEPPEWDDAEGCVREGYIVSL